MLLEFRKVNEASKKGALRHINLQMAERKKSLEEGALGSRAERAPLLHSRLRRLGQLRIPGACLRGHIATDIYNDVVCAHVKSLHHDRAVAPHWLYARHTSRYRIHDFGRCPKPVSRYWTEIIMVQRRNLNNRITRHLFARKREYIIIYIISTFYYYIVQILLSLIRLHSSSFNYLFQ